MATLEDGLYVLEDKLADPAFVDTMAKFVRASMKGWKWAEENPDDAAMIVLDNDETGAQTEEHQKRMMGEIAKLTAGSDGIARSGRLRADGEDAADRGLGPGDHQGARRRLEPRRHRQGARPTDAPTPAPRRGPGASPEGGADGLGQGGARTAARALCRRSRRADARSEVRAGGRAGVQPRGAAGALRRRADLPDRAAPDRRSGGAGFLRARRGDHRGADGPRRRATAWARGSGRGRSGRSSGSGPTTTSLDCAPIYDLAVADVGDVPFSSRYDIAASHREIEAWVAAIVAQGALPLSVGGDHSITYPILRAVGRRRAGRARPHRRAFGHRRAVRRAAGEPRGAVPQRGARGGARSDADGADRAARGVGVSLRVRHRQRHDLHPCRGDRHARDRGDDRAGAGGGRRGAGLRVVRHQLARPRLRAGHGDAGDRRADDARGRRRSCAG